MTSHKWHKFYSTKRWAHLRKRVLLRDLYTCTEPGCGVDVGGKMAHVHHIIPHKGSRSLFFDADNCRTVCADCHNGIIHRDELRGYSTAVGMDGWPTDDKHPFNVRERVVGRQPGGGHGGAE